MSSAPSSEWSQDGLGDQVETTSLLRQRQRSLKPAIHGPDAPWDAVVGTSNGFQIFVKKFFGSTTKGDFFGLPNALSWDDWRFAVR